MFLKYVHCAAQRGRDYIVVVCAYRPISPDHKKYMSSDSLATVASDASGKKVNSVKGDDLESLYVPEVEEIRVSPVVSRKGYLNFLEEKKNGWIKKWVVSE